MSKKQLRQIDLKELHKHFYECLKYFDEFCLTNNLQYAVMFGSLLGCIRDKGIIPWDGDVDLVMPYYDYDRLMTMKSLFDSEKYELTFPKCNRRTYSNEIRIKINDVYWKQKHQRGRYDRRVAIDIFIASPLSNDEKQNIKMNEDYKRVARLLYLKYDSLGHSNAFKKVVHSIVSGLLFVLNGNSLHERASEIERRYTSLKNPDKWFCPQDYGIVIPFPRSFFTDVERKQFGPITVNCSKKYEDFLIADYGENWMTPVNRNPSDDFETYFVKEL